MQYCNHNSIHFKHHCIASSSTLEDGRNQFEKNIYEKRHSNVAKHLITEATSFNKLFC